jgi:hypothetical protein
MANGINSYLSPTNGDHLNQMPLPDKINCLKFAKNFVDYLSTLITDPATENELSLLQKYILGLIDAFVIDGKTYSYVCLHTYINRLEKSKIIPFKMENIKMLTAVCLSLSLKMHIDKRYDDINSVLAELLSIPLTTFNDFEIKILNILGHNLYVCESEIRDALSILHLW